MKELVTYDAPGIETTYNSKGRLSKHQILFIVFLPLLFIFGGLTSIITTQLLGPFVTTNLILSTLVGFVIGVLVFVIFIPVVLRMPDGKISVHEYLTVIGINRIRPISRTLALFLPCLAFILISQIASSLFYNQFILGWEFSDFTNQLFNPERIGAVIGWSPIIAIGSIFEEIVLRGVVLTMLLKIYSDHKAVFGSAVAFGYVHIINLLNGPLTYELVTFVFAQIIWTTIIGVLYGYMFLVTGNLYANMFLHWFANGASNCFMYLPYVTPEIHALLNIIFNIGLMATLMSLLWIFVVSKYWPLRSQIQIINKIDNVD